MIPAHTLDTEIVKLQYTLLIFNQISLQRTRTAIGIKSGRSCWQDCVERANCEAGALNMDANYVFLLKHQLMIGRSRLVPLSFYARVRI